MTEHATNTSHARSRTQIKIRQQNLNKSITAQSDMLHQLDPNEFDIAGIQEPYLDFNHNTRATPDWFTIYPKEHYDRPNNTRSIILMNKRIPTYNWKQIEFASSDVTDVQIKALAGDILCINMYTDTQNSEGARKVIHYMGKKAHE